MEASLVEKSSTESVMQTEAKHVEKNLQNSKVTYDPNLNEGQRNVKSPEVLLDYLDSLIETAFGDCLASTVAVAAQSMHLSLWKQPTKTFIKGERMEYLPLFYIICSINQSLKTSMKLVTHHGKVIEELNETDSDHSNLPDDTKIKFVRKLCTAKLCSGATTPKDLKSYNAVNLFSSCLLEQLETDVILRSRECQFALFDSTSSRCQACQSVEAEYWNQDSNPTAYSLSERFPPILYNDEALTDDAEWDMHGHEDEMEKVSNTKQSNRLLGKRKGKHIFKCKHCDYKITKKEGMADHIISSHLGMDKIKDKEFKCNECTFVTNRKLLLEKHVQSSHEEMLKTESCLWPECSYKTNRSDRMGIHIAVVHKKITKPYSCDQCHFAFAERKGLQRHTNAVHKKIKPYLCTMCSFQTAYKETLNLHVNTIHHNLRPYECPKCDFKAPYQKGVDQHIRTVHENFYPFKCNQCSYEAARKNQVTRHISSVHEGVKPITCDLCDYRTDTKWHLLQHVSVKHSTEKPFKCKECSYQAARKNYLTDHIRSVHEKIKKFKCTQCPFLTTSNSSLTKHVCSVHNQAKPFSCQLCQSFEGITKVSLMKHMNELHSRTTNSGGSSISNSVIKVVDVSKE